MTGRTAANIIAFHFSSDIKDVQDCRYQPTRFANPAVYAMGDSYFCCPLAGQKLPTDHEIADRWDWQPQATYYGRVVYRAKANLTLGFCHEPRKTNR